MWKNIAHDSFIITGIPHIIKKLLNKFKFPVKVFFQL